MSSFSEILQGLGVLAAGTNGYFDATRDNEARQQDLMAKALQIAQLHQSMNLAKAREGRDLQEFERNKALQDYKLTQSQVAPLLKSNPAEAARLTNEAAKTMDTAGFGGFGGVNIKGGMMLKPHVDFAGGALPQGAVSTGREMPRPAANMVGPMPEAIKVPTFNTPQTDAAIRGAMSLPAETPEYKVQEYGRDGLGYWEIPASGGKPVFHPIQEPTENTGTVLSYNGDGTATVVPKKVGTTVKTKPAKGRASGGGSSKVKTRTETINGRRVLINAETGETIKDLGVAGKPDKAKESKAPKKLTVNEKIALAKLNAGTEPAAYDVAGKAAYDKRVKEEYAKIEANEGRGALKDELRSMGLLKK